MVQLETKCCQWHNWRPTTLVLTLGEVPSQKKKNKNSTHSDNFIVTTITFLKIWWDQMKNYSYIVIVPITNLIVTPKQPQMNIPPNVCIVVVPLAEKCSMKLFPKGNSHLLVV
jgi:hypothetical protein